MDKQSAWVVGSIMFGIVFYAFVGYGTTKLYHKHLFPADSASETSITGVLWPVTLPAFVGLQIAEKTFGEFYD